MEPARRDLFILIAVWFVLILTWITISPTNDQNKMTQDLERPSVMENPYRKGTSTAFPPERFKPQSICEKTDENIIKESSHYSSSNHQTCIKNCDKSNENSTDFLERDEDNGKPRSKSSECIQVEKT